MTIPQNGKVTRYAPFNGRRKNFVKVNGQWFKAKNGAASGRPLPACNLLDALDKDLANQNPE